MPQMWSLWVLLLVLGVTFANYTLTTARDYGRWKDCSYVQSNSTNFPFAFGCSKVIAPMNNYGITLMESNNLDKYMEIYDTAPLSQFNLCSWEPLASYGFTMEQTCMQYFCSPNNTNDRSWVNKYLPSIGLNINMPLEDARDQLDAMIHNYCFYCKNRPSSDDFYTFHTMIRQNGTCNFTWTIPDPKCGGIDVGVPYGLGLQRRFKLRLPTLCYCHQFDRFRFACDVEIHGAIIFFYEVLPFFTWVLGSMNSCGVWLLVLIPTHIRKWMQILQVEKKQIMNEILEIRYLACCYMTIGTIFQFLGDTFSLIFDRMFYERGIYLHQPDFACSATAGVLIITAHGLMLINWVNLLHFASTLENKIPLWSKIITVLFTLIMTTSAFCTILGNTIPPRDGDIANGFSIHVYVVAFIAMVLYGPGFLLYGLRLLHILRKSNKEIHPFNYRFIRFSIGLGVLAVFTAVEIALIAVQLFGDQAYNYGFRHVNSFLQIDVHIFILLLAYLLFKKENLPKCMQGKKDAFNNAIELKDVKPNDRVAVTLVESDVVDSGSVVTQDSPTTPTPLMLYENVGDKPPMLETIDA